MSNSVLDKIKKTFVSVSDSTPSRMKILFRPDRWQYIKKTEPVAGCVFCRASAEKSSLETLTVYKSNHSMILLNKFPYNAGHILVIPLRHEGDFLKLTQAEHEDLHETLRVAIMALKDVYVPHGINVGLNLDKAAGAGIPEHMHYHVIPRFTGDMNFFPIIAETKVIPEALETTYKKLKTFFDAYKEQNK